MNSARKKGELLETNSSGITISDRLKIKEILTATILSLCKNSVGFEHELTIEGLLGITVDKTDIVLVSISEVFDNVNQVSHTDDQVISRTPIEPLSNLSSNVSQTISPTEQFVKPCNRPPSKRLANDDLPSHSQSNYEVHSAGQQRCHNIKKRRTGLTNTCSVSSAEGSVRERVTNTVQQDYRRQSNGVRREPSQTYIEEQYDGNLMPMRVKTERIDERFCETGQNANDYKMNATECTDVYQQEEYEEYVEGEQEQYQYAGDGGSIDGSEGHEYPSAGGGYRSSGVDRFSTNRLPGSSSNKSGVRQPWMQSSNTSRKAEKCISNKKPTVKIDPSIVGNWSAASATATGNKELNQTMIQRALNLVREGQLSASTAISIFGIARSTFYKKLAELAKSEGAREEKEAEGWAEDEGGEWKGDTTDNGGVNTVARNPY